MALHRHHENLNVEEQRGGEIENLLPDLTKGTILICLFWGMKMLSQGRESNWLHNTHQF